jgi:predicted phosphodiesterase
LAKLKKYGVFTDTHGNLAALEKIYAYFREIKCDEIIHLGDMITMGGQSRECLDFFFSKEITLIKGNHDIDYVKNRVERRGESRVPQRHKEFVFESIGEGYREKIDALPLLIYRDIGGKRVAFLHYALSAVTGITFIPIFQQPTREIFDGIFAPLEADAVFFGHKHEPIDLTGNALYVDVGSVGCHNCAEARGVVIEEKHNGFTYKRIALPYDRKGVFLTMQRLNVPCAEEIFDYYFKEAQNKGDL